jgi:hypothetical protein
MTAFLEAGVASYTREPTMMVSRPFSVVSIVVTALLYAA